MSAALLVTAALPAFSAFGSYDDADDGYSIEIFRPRDTDVEHPKNFKLGAYQLFTGTVPEEPAETTFNTSEESTNPGWDVDPGTENKALKLADIKWGSAFGDLTEPTNQTNLKNYIMALATADSTKFPGLAAQFVNLVDASKTDFAAAYKDEGTVLYDKLANAVANILSGEKMQNNRKLLQYFTDITAGYGNNAGDSTQKGYLISENYYNGTNNYSVNTEGVLAGTAPVWTFKVPAGYYLIKDLTPHGDDLAQDSYAYSARMLFVAGNVVQTLKSSVPAVQKDIITQTKDNTIDTLQDSQVAGVGDEVKFILRGSLPSNFDKFVSYKYSFTDTLSDGLDFLYKGSDTASSGNVNNSVTVSAHGAWYSETDSPDLEIGTWEWKPNADISIPVQDDGTAGYVAKVAGKTLTVDFANLREIVVQVEDTTDENTPDGYYRLGYNYASIDDNEEDDDTSSSFGGAIDENSSTIRVIYSATVNKNAVVNPADGDNKNGNKNEVFITYSNNPQNAEETDNTVTDIAEVYTLGLDIYKFDYAKRLEGDTSGETLNGVNFAVLRKVADNSLAEPAKYYWQIAELSGEITGTADSSSFVTNKYRSVLEWTDLKDYSTSTTAGVNVSSETKGEKLIELVKAYIQKNNGKVGGSDVPTRYWEITTQDGNAYLSGLDQEEEYTLVETKLPGDDGEYAQLMPFTVTLTANKNADSGEYDGTVSKAEVSNNYTDSMSMEKYVKADDAKNADGIAKIDVVNFKYKDLPSTGGLGVMMYYIAGVFVLAVAVVFFILARKTPKKKSA